MATLEREEDMRTVTYGAACSLDGFIAGPGGSVDWLHFSKDVQEVMGRYWATIDTLLMGRKTWEFAAANAPGGEANNPMTGIRTYVFSRTLKELDRPGVELVSSDPGAFVRDLKSRPGKGICVMGGGELARSLLDAGVVDEVGLNVHPVLLGAGIRMFPDGGGRTVLTLAQARQIDGGCMLLDYKVNG
jgi:dihydrofolate reductase